ncbi:phosphoribosylanthranilate isomerase [Woodsholea maritima]|uniref:phosphoribosylanthranilate isomerase n=1 Tax=Woodsholea maritima TaxID=240237 RepID=UPI00035E6328|nr:phosphoribosylanthranilate isomerase [Woodsholea maritima]
MAQVKICGIKNNQALETALKAGAEWVGFVIFEKSPRHVDFEIAAELVRQTRDRAKTVVVVVDPDDPTLAKLASIVKPDIIQLHGSESPARCGDVRAYAREGVWKAFGLRTHEDLARASAYRDYVDGFVFDAKPPQGADRPGGWGERFDGTILKDYPQSPPWLLSGGLDVDTVREALALSGASAVDVSSGVESAPGVKDPNRIQAFIDAARLGPL